MSIHEFEVRFDARQIRRTTWAYVRIRIARQLKWYDRLVLLAIPFVWLWLFFESPHCWMVWLIAAIACSFVFFMAIAWTMHIRHHLERLALMKVPVAKISTDDAAITLTSDLGSATMPWTTLTGTADGPEALYLESGKGVFVTLPTGGVDPAALQFIRERVAHAGAHG